MPKNKPKILVIVGPTASGKSDLAVQIAKKYNSEIISADSRQIYRGMDIGTGKITKREMLGIPHHLLDVVSPQRQFTVVHYQRLGQKAIEKILDKGKLPIIVGGSGFYIDALINDIQLPNIKPDPQLRTQLEKQTTEQLYTQLQQLDPRRAKTIDRHNRRRLYRALEIVITTGQPVPKITANRKYQALSIGIALPDVQLHKHIHDRLLKRMKHGLIAEVKKLQASGLSWQRLDNFGLEYRWVSRYLQGLISKQDMLDKLETEIWHYAKRQLTWFKNQNVTQTHHIFWINNLQQAKKLVMAFLMQKSTAKW